MASNEQQQRQQEAPQIYTIYPGQGNINYGFHASHPQAPPPKYEDVMNGTYQTQHVQHPVIIQQERIEPDGVIFLAARPKLGGIEKAIGLIFTFVILICFVSVMIKILGKH